MIEITEEKMLRYENRERWRSIYRKLIEREQTPDIIDLIEFIKNKLHG